MAYAKSGGSKISREIVKTGQSGCSKLSRETALVFEQDRQLWTTSVIVAERFGKRHNNVLRDIENAFKDIPMSFQLRNFLDTTYTDVRGKTQRMFLMTEEGFALIIMGFTGKEAMGWKVRFIEAFQQMRAALTRTKLHKASIEWQSARTEGKLVRREETDMIAHFIEYAKMQGSKGAAHYFNLFTTTTYTQLFDMKGTDEDNLRERLTSVQLHTLLLAENAVADLIYAGILAERPYKDIYADAKAKIADIANALGGKSLPGALPERKSLGIVAA